MRPDTGDGLSSRSHPPIDDHWRTGAGAVDAFRREAQSVREVETATRLEGNEGLRRFVHKIRRRKAKIQSVAAVPLADRVAFVGCSHVDSVEARQRRREPALDCAADGWRRWTAAVWGLLLCFAAACGGAAAQERPIFIAPAWDVAVIDKAFEDGALASPPPAGVTGVTVPHHLLAADLIARGVLAASAGRYDHILLIAPDHMRRLRAPFGVLTGPIETVFGPFRPHPSSENLTRRPALFQPLGAAADEHGVHAVTPFLKRVFPDASLTAVLARTSAPRAAWDAAVAALTEQLDGAVLVVQSTDYSHHLKVGPAARRDQETIAAIMSGDPEAVFALEQGPHLDSRAAQYVMTRLQRERFGAAPVIIGNRNSIEYAGDPEAPGTTSYVVAAFTPDPADAARLRADDHEVLFIGGDFFAGRGMTDFVDDPDGLARMAAAVRALTDGAPLIVNLEGVILDRRPNGAVVGQHVMMRETALRTLAAFNVRGVSLANNHTFDFGREGYETTRAALASAGLAVIEHGAVTDLGGARVAGMTARRSAHYVHPVARDAKSAAFLCDQPAAPPVIVLAHWGGAGQTAAKAAERQQADMLARCGAAAILGAHPHRASGRITLVAGGATQMVFSLGNFLFDQSSRKSSGALVELRVFRQGTVAARLAPAPNLMELAARAAREEIER